MVASDAREFGVAAGGGAAAIRSPEQPRRRADAAADAERGAGDSAVVAPFRHAAVGEEGEAATAKLAVGFDLSGRGGAARTRGGGGGDVRPRAGERREGADLRVVLHRGPRSYFELRSGPCTREMLDCGFDFRL